MLIKCPNCNREYELEIGKDVVEFGFTCPNCKSELVVTDNKEVVQATSPNPSQPSSSYSVHVQPTTPQNHWGCFKTVALILFVTIILLIITCPDARDHKDKIQSVTTTAVDDLLKKQDNSILATLGMMYSSKLVEVFITDKITIENYFLFSVGYYYNDGKHHMISFGVLNHVFTPSEEQIQNNLINYFSNNQQEE